MNTPANTLGDTQLIPIGKCIPSRFQPKTRNRRKIESLARNIQTNGQLSAILVVRDGDAYQTVLGHRRVEAMKSIGKKWVRAEVCDSWQDERIARCLAAENSDREGYTDSERGELVQTMLQLGVPVTEVAASLEMPAEKVRDYARGTQRAGDLGSGYDIDAYAKIGKYGDLLTDEEVGRIADADTSWRVDEIINAARSRDAAAKLTAELEAQGFEVVESVKKRGKDHYVQCFSPKGPEGIKAIVEPFYGGRAKATYYRIAEENSTEPTPEQAEANKRFEERKAVAADLDAHVVEFVKSIYPKFPGQGHSKLKAWAHRAFAERYACARSEAWAGVKEKASGAVDRFVLSRAIPQCLPKVPERALREGAWIGWDDERDAKAYYEFHAEVMAFARYKPTDAEKELLEHLRLVLGYGEDGGETGAASHDAGETPSEAGELAPAAA